MGRTYPVALALVLLTATWVSAGNFEVLADAGVVRTPTPLHSAPLQPGTLVKAEFKSNLKTSSDVDMDSDTLFPEPVAAKPDPKVQPRPAVAFKERPTRGMAPPPSMNVPAEAGSGTVTTTNEESDEFESDLERGLVITPPPAKGQEAEKTKPKASGAPAKGMEKPAATDRKAKPAPAEQREKAATKEKPAPTVKLKSPTDYGQRAQSDRPIQKVKPITAATTKNPWSYPAGNYGHRAPAASAQRVQVPPRVAHNGFRPMEPPVVAPQTREITRPPAADRFVHDGVTVKLAPTAGAPAASYPQPGEEEYDGSDLFSTAAEIIGMPFAFISSLF